MDFNRIAVAAVVLIALAAGSAYALTMNSVGAEDPTHTIHVINNDDEAHAVEVRVVSSGEDVVNSTEEVSAGDEWDVATQREAGDYELIVSTSGGSTGEDEYTLPLAEDGRESFSTVRIDNSSSVTIQTYWQE